MLLLSCAVAPRCLAPEGPASVAPAGATNRDRKAVENVNGVAGRKHEVEDPLLDQRQRRTLPGEGLIPFRTYCVVRILSHPSTFMLVRLYWCPSLSWQGTTMDSRPDAGAWRGFANRAEGFR